MSFIRKLASFLRKRESIGRALRVNDSGPSRWRRRRFFARCRSQLDSRACRNDD
jgi:hypothetical protein